MTEHHLQAFFCALLDINTIKNLGNSLRHCNYLLILEVRELEHRWRKSTVFIETSLGEVRMEVWAAGLRNMAQSFRDWKMTT